MNTDNIFPAFATWTTDDLTYTLGTITRSMARGIVTETGAAQAYAIAATLRARGVTV